MDENRISDLPFVLYELPFERLHWSHWLSRAGWRLSSAGVQVFIRGTEVPLSGME